MINGALGKPMQAGGAVAQYGTKWNGLREDVNDAYEKFIAVAKKAYEIRSTQPSDEEALFANHGNGTTTQTASVEDSARNISQNTINQTTGGNDQTGNYNTTGDDGNTGSTAVIVEPPPKIIVGYGFDNNTKQLMAWYKDGAYPPEVASGYKMTQDTLESDGWVYYTYSNGSDTIKLRSDIYIGFQNTDQSQFDVSNYVKDSKNAEKVMNVVEPMWGWAGEGMLEKKMGIKIPIQTIIDGVSELQNNNPDEYGIHNARSRNNVFATEALVGVSTGGIGAAALFFLHPTIDDWKNKNFPKVDNAKEINEKERARALEEAKRMP